MLVVPQRRGDALLSRIPVGVKGVVAWQQREVGFGGDLHQQRLEAHGARVHQGH